MASVLYKKDLIGRFRTAISALRRAPLMPFVRRSDVLFTGLLAGQWAGAVAAARWLSPVIRAGHSGQFRFDIWAAVLLGGCITTLPVAVAWFRAGNAAARHAVKELDRAADFDFSYAA